MAPPIQAGPRMVPPNERPPGGRAPNPREPRPPRKRRRRLSLFAGLFWPLRVLATVVLVALVIGIAGGVYLFQRDTADLPSLAALRHYHPDLMTRLYASNDQLQAELGTQRRIFVPIADIPKVVQQAFIAVEDHSFYEHPGIDPAAIIRAAIFDALRLGEHKRPLGASTITQQVVKNILLNDKVSLRRKIREAILAIRIERVMSKQQILELYLNQIYLGEGAYGVAAAAQAYFDKPIGKITLPEAAMLASLPKAPSYFDPFVHPKAALIRRNYALDRMVANGAITQAQADAAKATPIEPVPYARPRTIDGAGYFNEEVRQRLIERFGEKLTLAGGLTVHTTLDPRLQKLADRALHDGLLAYDRRHPAWRGPAGHVTPPAGVWAEKDWAKALAEQKPPPGMLARWQEGLVVSETPAAATIGILRDGKPETAEITFASLHWARHEDADGNLGPPPGKISDVLVPGDLVMLKVTPPAKGKPLEVALRQIPSAAGAILALDPATGRVLAMSGGWSFDISQFDRATQAERQPGSSFKPFVYLAAMEQNISPSQRFLDAPFVVNLGAAGKWRPGNYEGSFEGPTSLHTALGQSLNLVTVRLAAHIGMRKVADVADAFGMADKLPLLLPAALGAIDTTVMREAGAYAALDTLGIKVVPHFIDSVSDREGKVIWRDPGLACEGCNDPTAPPRIVDRNPRIADAQSTFQVVMMMHGVVINGTGAGTQAQFKTELAGKTGTTNNFVDAWFSGFSPDLVTVVWIGYDTPRSLGYNEQGALAALPFWQEFMKEALADRPVLQFKPPAGVTVASWPAERGEAIDAFKPGQTPGVSGPLDTGGETASATDVSASPSGGAPASGSGVDNPLGGLY